MTALLKKNSYTFEEFLALELTADYKSEYHNGQIFAMSGGKHRHGVIANNIGAALREVIKAKGKKCMPSNSDVLVYVEALNKGLYPDAMVVCGDTQYKTNSEVAVLNPLLIVEVLSKSTASYDRSEKFQYYRHIPSFQEYILVSQDQPKVECFYKAENGLWHISFYTGLDKVIQLRSIDCEISVAEFYTFLDFPDGVQTVLDL